VVDTFESYKVLDIEPGSSAERVRQAYLELAQTWDPDRYAYNPILREQAEKKRMEIEEAYHALRSFLPDLQGLQDEDEGPRPVTRDFKELERQAATEKAKAIMGILVAIILFGIFVFAIFLLVKGRSIAPAPSVPLE
jgi:curved DNA-binding protein CbpA